jgi:hypothetical protein
VTDTEHFLLLQHRKLIEDSGISEEVATARGYRSVTTRAELKRLGFADSQCRVPALLLPVYGVGGEIVSYQIRPDMPRIRDGKALKYETPAKSRMAVDVPPLARAMLGKPDVPLIVTEGIRKADAAASHGLCCIDVLGVWNWRGTNPYGGKLVLPDFESIALNGRDVYLCFDSDVVTKPAVRQALDRLSAFLTSRGASVKVLLLPTGDVGVKTGLDDYLAADHSPADLFSLVVDRLPGSTEATHGASSGPYRVVDGGIAWVRPSGDDEQVIRLCNFTAEIVSEVIADDGQTEQGELLIRGTREDGTSFPELRVPLNRFDGLQWVSRWGVRAILFAGQGSRDRVREAMQRMSPEVVQRREYTHPGWRRIDGQWCFLTQGAVIGADGAVGGIVVRLSGSASRLQLPVPPGKTAAGEAVTAVLGLLDLAPDRLIVPLLGGVFRSLLNQSAQADVVLFLTGASGALKSELAALMQRFFGPAFERTALPASWASTTNALERIAFDFKDCLLVIDDFAPSGSPIDVRRYHQVAERVIRGAGNVAGRERMQADGTVRPSLPPRGILLGTGEDVPTGYSIRARMLVLHVGTGDIDGDRLKAWQLGPGREIPSRMLAGYVRWLAGRMDQLKTDLGLEVDRLRTELQATGTHARTPEALASLGAAWRLWIAFARETGAVSHHDGVLLWERVRAALVEVAAAQAALLAQEHPVERFLELLAGAIAAGAAHVAGPAGDEPKTPQAWGWQERITGSGDFTRQEWQLRGRGVGWLDETGLYLEPQAVYQAVQHFAQGTGITVTAPTLWKRMEEGGLLQSTARDRGTRYVRRTFAGARRKVIHLASDVLFPAEPEDKIPEDQADDEADDEEDPKGAAPVQVSLLPRPAAGQFADGAGQAWDRWTDQRDGPKTA